MMQHKKIIRTFAASTMLVMTCMLPMNGQNYIKTETYLDEDEQRHTTEIQYYDGLGRESVAASDAVSTEGKYVYTMQTYDGNGREYTTWLPVVGNQNVVNPSISTFNNMSLQTYPDVYGFSSKQYDALNRLVSIQTPGSAWQGHLLTKSYGTNSTREVKLYKAQLSDNSLLKLGYYPAGSLTMEQTVDEDGRVTQVYKDFLDRKVLERCISGEDSLNTYYVFNDRGELSYVLTPEYQNSGYKDLYAYEYRYDDHGRIEKKLLPGCDYTQYWYDKKGRVISEQNPTLRENGKYRFTLYDNLGRVAIQGVCTNVNYHREFDVTMSTSSGFLATRYNYPYASAITHPDLEVVNYYDNYLFRFSSRFSQFQPYWNGASLVNGGGLLTGQIRRTKTQKYILTAFYYDEKGQLIEKKEILDDGSNRITATAYSFTGKPVSETTTLIKNGTTYTEQKDLEYYDENDKLKKLTIGYNGTDSLLIGQYVYDDLGRVSTLQRGGNAGSVSYDYNLRGWTTYIDGKGFKEWLHYTDGIGTCYYTGNISSMLWQTDNQNFKRGYCFYYDSFGRMTQAYYGEGEDMSEHTNRYTEWVKEYTRSGGIRKIERYGLKDDGKYGKIDNLRMYYNGMKIRTVKEDALPVTRSGAFDFVSKTVNVVGAEYDYYDDGALRWDANKGISLIQYDDRGYPSRVQFSNGNVTEYIYASDGEKLRTVYQTAVPNISVALGSTLTLNSSNTLSTDTIEYVGNFIFRNGVLEKALFTGGYATFANNQATYHYFTQDHLGNNRAVVNQDGTVEQRVHYYPFGAVYAHVSTDALQRYKYNGKELDRMYGLNQYDYGARNYDPLLCRFTTVDPLAEKYYSVSPYAYCLNNPVNAIDTDGKWVWPVVSAAIDYGFQVFNNLQDGNNFADATFNNVNFSEVGLSAINPTGKFSTLKTLAVEAVKATVSISPTKGMEINNDISIVATKTLLNTGANKVAGKVVEKSSSASLTKANNELKSAVGNVKHAQTKIQQRTNAKGWEKTLEKSRASAVVAREKQVATQMLNSTVGQVNENISNSFISNGLQEIWKDWVK